MTFSEMIRGDLSDPIHGSKATYDRHKCRCDRCRLANRNYMREYRKNRSEA
jgi:hypothetical protein